MSLEFTTYISDLDETISTRLLREQMDSFRPGSGHVDSDNWLVTPLTATEVRVQGALISTSAGTINTTASIFTAVRDKSAAGAAIEESVFLISAAYGICASNFATIYCGSTLIATSIQGELYLDSRSGFWSISGRSQFFPAPAEWLPLRVQNLDDRPD